MPRLIVKPPRLSHANSNDANANGLSPALRIADAWVVTPSAAIAMASMKVSKLIAGLVMDFGRMDRELNAATAMKPSANQGTTMAVRGRVPPGEAALGSPLRDK